MEQITSQQNQVHELEEKIKALNKQIRARNATLACVIAASGGSVRVPESIYRTILEEHAGATFRTERDGSNNDFIVIAEMVPKAAAAV